MTVAATLLQPPNHSVGIPIQRTGIPKGRLGNGVSGVRGTRLHEESEWDGAGERQK